MVLLSKGARIVVMGAGRILVTLALLAIAAGLLFQTPNFVNSSMGMVIVGAVTGYWLRHIEDVTAPPGAPPK